VPCPAGARRTAGRDTAYAEQTVRICAVGSTNVKRLYRNIKL